MPDKTAFLFPGQGSQSVGMVREVSRYPEAVAVFRQANEMLSFDLFALCLTGSEEKLNQDFYAQLAVHVTNVAFYAILEEKGIVPQVASGFSLGIFSALVAAGSLRFSQGLEGVKMAAEKMAEEGSIHGGAMAAVIGLAEQEVSKICEDIPSAFVASVNTARQVVVSGESGAVEKAIRLCQERGALLAKRLPIGWAIHTPLMKRASQAFAEAIQGWEILPPRFPVISYLRGDFLKTPEEIRDDLCAQFSHPNRWHQVLLRMVTEGVDRFIEVGPGRVLIQMMQWVHRQGQGLVMEDLLKSGFPLSWERASRRGRE
ncbi:MAG: ACP S-malonyltransferase [Deltaproteobacteria bacterium]|nr:ACP S-malonyltransferase [Deltaproteobacteria bacterium]